LARSSPIDGTALGQLSGKQFCPFMGMVCYRLWNGMLPLMGMVCYRLW
jgi:hypothetical protein